MTTADRLDERYGRRHARRSRRIAIGVAAVAAAVVVGVLGWSTLAAAARTVDVDTVAFRLESPGIVEVTFQVTPPAGTAFACVLEAQDVEHGVVGWRVVEFEPLTTRPARFTEAVPTVAEATTGLVERCWVT